MRIWLIGALVLLVGCGDPTSNAAGSGGDGGAAGVGGASGGSGTGGGGCDAPPSTGTCSDPLLSFEPIGAMAFQSTGGGGSPIAGRIDPFPVPTVCHTLIVGLFNGSGCVLPSIFTMSAWDEPTTTPSPVVPAEVNLLLKNGTVRDLGGGASEYRFAVTQHYGACRYPFVALWGQSGLCGVRSLPACDETKAWVRLKDGWHPLSDGAAVKEQMYFGVADCSPE